MPGPGPGMPEHTRIKHTFFKRQSPVIVVNGRHSVVCAKVPGPKRPGGPCGTIKKGRVRTQPLGSNGKIWGVLTVKSLKNRGYRPGRLNFVVNTGYLVVKTLLERVLWPLSCSGPGPGAYWQALARVVALLPKKRALPLTGKTLLREHYMKMKKTNPLIRWLRYAGASHNTNKLL